MIKLCSLLNNKRSQWKILVNGVVTHIKCCFVHGWLLGTQANQKVKGKGCDGGTLHALSRANPAHLLCKLFISISLIACKQIHLSNASLFKSHDFSLTQLHQYQVNIYIIMAAITVQTGGDYNISTLNNNLNVVNVNSNFSTTIF